MGESFTNPFTDPFLPPTQQSHFHKVIALHEEKDLDWSKVSRAMPVLPRGWYELSRLPVEDRIEFTRVFWLAKLPDSAFVNEIFEKRIVSFFDQIEEIGIYATKVAERLPFEIHMVYGLANASGFFVGFPPATINHIENLEKQFSNVGLPSDYIGFLQIHDGFSKYTDTGLIKIREMSKTYLKFQQMLGEEIIVAPDGQVISPSSLIPFYESYGLHCYQCFFTEWCPSGEMGNIYFSEHEKMMSNFFDSTSTTSQLAFPTFLDWLCFYLEDTA
ncbi:MAG: SMI1/KNR4 family protein [Chlamydiia bacterium]|nr:SMI1/KNR4 family protein [Chlamydiia bacterium]